MQWLETFSTYVCVIMINIMIKNYESPLMGTHYTIHRITDVYDKFSTTNIEVGTRGYTVERRTIVWCSVSYILKPGVNRLMKWNQIASVIIIKTIAWFVLRWILMRMHLYVDFDGATTAWWLVLNKFTDRAAFRTNHISPSHNSPSPFPKPFL